MNPLFFKLKSFWLLIVGKIKLHQMLFKWVSLGLATFLILSIIAGFLYYNFYFKRDGLIKYVPKEAIMYSTFKINGEIKENQLAQDLISTINIKYNLPEIDPAILNPYIAYNFAVALIPRENNFYEYYYLVLLDLRERPDENILKEKGLYWHYFKNDYISTDIMAISSSPKIIEKVISVRNQEWPSLVSRLGVTFNLNQLKINKTGKIFIDVKGLGKHFNEINDIKLKTLFAALNSSKIDELYLSTDFKDNKIVISNDDSIIESNLLLPQIPSDYIASLSSNNAQEQFLHIINIVNQLDHAYYQQISKNIEYSQGVLNLNWQNDVLPLFAENSQLIIYPKQKFLLAIDIANTNDIKQSLIKIEEAISSVLLVNEPKLKEKQLKDGTFITQIIKDNNLEFDSKIINDIQVKEIRYNGQEFGYYLDNKKLILANNLDLIGDLINNNDLFTLNSENLANNSTNITINSLSYANIWPILAILGNINLIENNGKILLILE